MVEEKERKNERKKERKKESVNCEKLKNKRLNK